jgi:hypothetical protein
MERGGSVGDRPQQGTIFRTVVHAGRGATADEKNSLGPVSDRARPGMERGGSVGDRPQQGTIFRTDPNLYVLIGYLLLTLGLTCPLLIQFARAIPGDGFDGWQNYWNLWWVKVALLDRHILPYYTDLLYHPTGVGLLFHTLNPFNGLFSLPVQAAWGLIPAYNAVVLFSFVIGGFGAYLLARQVLGPGSSRLSAFAAGVIFTFAPFHFAHLLGHMQVFSLEWIPFYALYLIRTVSKTQNVIRNTWRNVLLAAFFLVLIALCDWYYVLYCLILTAVVLVWAAWRWGRQRIETDKRINEGKGPFPPRTLAPLHPRTPAPSLRIVVAVAGVWLIWAAALSPLLVPMVREARASRFMVPDPAQSRILSADLLAFVTPQEFHPLWGWWAQARAKSFTSTVSEHSVFVGFTALVLAVLGLWDGWKRRPVPCGTADEKKLARAGLPGPSARTGRPCPPWSTRWLGQETGHSTSGQSSGLRYRALFRTGPWPLALLVFFFLALGPVLHVGGRTNLLPGGGEILLPYGWLAQVVPFMEITRSVSRFDVMVMLVMAVLAAFGLQWLSRLGKGGRGVAVAAVGLILFEFLPAPYPMSQPDTPAWYYALAADPRPGAVLNLPMNWDRPGYLLYQTIHGKPLTAAYISREDPRTLADRAPVLQHFRHLGPDVIAFDLAAQGEQVLHDLDVRWVVLDRYKMPGGQEREYTEAKARLIFGDRSPLYQDDRLTVYEVVAPPGGNLRPATAAPYLILGAGWEPFDKAQHGRAFTGRGTVIVQAPAAGTATLRVTVAPGSAGLDLPLADGAHSVQLALRPGANEVVLQAQKPGARVIVTELAMEQ